MSKITLSFRKSTIQVRKHGLEPLGAFWNGRALCSADWRMYLHGGEGAALTHRTVRIAMAPGRVFLVSPGLDVRGSVEGRPEQFFVHFGGTVEATALRDGVHELDPALEVAGLMARIGKAGQGGALRDRLVASFLLACLDARVTRSWLEGASARVDPRIRAAVELLETDPGPAVDLDNLASRIRLSKNALIRLFRRETGRTPYRFHLDRRLERGRDLLEEGAEIQDVSERCGFSDRFQFSKQFKNHFGTTPGSLRREGR